MKRLIVTRADDKVRDITRLTHPIIKRFARKWGADFLVLDGDEPGLSDWKGKLHYRIMRLYDLFEEYDRIANIDSDTVINKNCPNLFASVPDDKIGVVYEDKGTRQADRRQRIQYVQNAWGDIGWREGYINTGVSVFSRSHREIFRRFEGRYWEGRGYPDIHLGYQIHRLGIEIFELDWRFNHMSMFSEKWNGHASRFDSHILHYAGHAKFPDRGNKIKVQQIAEDIARIYG